MKQAGLTSKVSYEVRSCNRCLILRALFGNSQVNKGLQLSRLEHTPDKREVGGSSPLEPTKVHVVNLGKILLCKTCSRETGTKSLAIAKLCELTCQFECTLKTE